MKLHFLGTGAADWNPNLADNTLDFRRFSSLLINDSLLIDPGPCIFEFEKTFGYTSLLKGVKKILVTHRHADHYSEDSAKKLSDFGAVHLSITKDNVYEDEEYKIFPYPANHATSENPVHYLIESKSDGKKLFYGCDGAWLFYDTYRALVEQKNIDMMIFDCTIGDIHGDYRIFEHNNVTMVSEMRALFKSVCPRFMVSHLARTLHPSHEECVALFAEKGFEVAYDNLITEI